MDDSQPNKCRIERGEGGTASERYLKTLCDKCFLSLWSHPRIFRDQRGSKGQEGKEVCDLLVVFENHIIIFSDKHCEFTASGDFELAWSRWFRKTVKDSARQVWGAERWIKQFPDRLFLDKACSVRFPISLPPPDQAIFHRIVVAHGISAACRKIVGGNGSLMIMPDIVGDAHEQMPFTIGTLDPDKGYVHVFDDTTLDVVLGTLDTVTDFIGYLTKKERLLTSSLRVTAAGEEELLARYLTKINSLGEHDFEFPNGYDVISLDEGFWKAFLASGERKRQLKADEVSYSWDKLIETFAKNMLDGTQYFATRFPIAQQERALRFLAREPRTRRRMLAKALIDRVVKTPATQRAARVLEPTRAGDPFYIFVVLGQVAGISDKQYREARSFLLSAYARVLRLVKPQARHIVGIATEPGTGSRRSEDLLYLDGSKWRPQDDVEARRLQAELGLLKETRRFYGHESDYPPEDSASESKEDSTSRNSSCPCGSGKRFKRCHGAKLRQRKNTRR